MNIATWFEGDSWRIFTDEQRGLVKDIAFYQAGLVKDLDKSPVFLSSRESWYISDKVLWFQLKSVNKNPYMQLYSKPLLKELEALLIVYGLQ
ncbi:hypothetical protein [Pseudomonas phage vB_PaeP_PS28]|nr:hypothetical protein [Pseudomonas phage vB_PaeP_PS28]